MELGLFQQQTLKPYMTQELRQAISILQYSRQELTQFIREQALENPLIELTEPSYEAYAGTGGTTVYRGNEDYNPFDFIKDERGGMKEDLLQQARCLRLEEPIQKRLAYLILLLDEDGYLPADIISEMADQLRLPEEESENLLALLQKLEPAGVGARNLRECLLLQIKRLAPNDDLAREMVSSHMDLMAKKNWRELTAKLSVSMDEVHETVRWIQETLQPRPGSVYDTEKTRFMIPDVTVKKSGGRYQIIIHDDFLPAVHVNRDYDAYLHRKARDEATLYVNEKYKQVMWLVKSLEQRRLTLLKVMEIIIRKQADFLDNGFRRLKPMTLREVAAEAGVHESTVSRTIRNKNVQTPFGLYEMRSFFSSKLSAANGSDASSASVKLLIKEIVNGEDVRKPFSDQKISVILKTVHGISVSRRTVAKYREQLHIQASSRRKS